MYVILGKEYNNTGRLIDRIGGRGLRGPGDPANARKSLPQGDGHKETFVLEARVRIINNGTVSAEGGTWRLADNAGAQIVIDAACLCLTGSVEIYAETLDVNQTFTTTGQLSLSGKDTLIDVADGKTARFSAPNNCAL